MLLLLAAALSAQSAQDIRCVAVLGIVAYDQGRDASEWADLPSVRADGERFAGIVGERTMKESGRTREAVKALILAEVAAVQKAKTITRAEVETCIARMAVVAPKPDIVRCAGAMAEAADRVRAAEGASTGAKDLATLASVLAYRARIEGTAKGRSEAQVADAVKAARTPMSDEDLADCAQLAAAE